MSIFKHLLQKWKRSSGCDPETYYGDVSSLNVKVCISTHNGKVRTNNEDNFSLNGIVRKLDENIVSVQRTISTNSLLLEVCDGMGGEANGEIASDIAVNNSKDLLKHLNNTDEDHITDAVNDYVNSTNSKICAMLKNSESSRGGSTFALVYIRNKTVFPFSLGDSRIYVYTAGNLKQISIDHTLAMRKYKANIYTLEEAEQSPDSHKLTLFLGVDVNDNGLNSEVYEPFELTKNSKLLICSDGLYDMCSREEISKVLAQDLEDHSQVLVDMALEHGGIDNITCLVAEIV